MKFKFDAIKLDPCLGLSSLEDIFVGQKSLMRDLALHFPLTELPDKADSLDAPGYAFSYHDFYHAILASSVGELNRELILSLADEVKKMVETHPDLNLLPYLRESLIDLELLFYQEEFFQLLFNDKAANRVNMKFWINLANCFIKAKLMKSANNIQTTQNENLYVVSPQDREILHMILQMISIDPDYKEGILRFGEEMSKRANIELSLLQGNTTEIFNLRKKLEDLRDNNLYLVIGQLWNSRVLAEEAKLPQVR